MALGVVPSVLSFPAMLIRQRHRVITNDAVTYCPHTLQSRMPYRNFPSHAQDLNTSANVYRFGLFTLNTATRQISRDGETLRVSPQQFDLLTALVVNRQRVLHRAEMMRLVWPRSIVSKGALPQAMLKLRQLLGGEQAAAQWLATVRGVGYRFVGEVAVEAAAPPQRSTSPPSIATPTADISATQHRVDVLRRQAWERWIRLDDELRETVAALGNRDECGRDPRARVLALVYQSAVSSRQDDMLAAWRALEEAERLVEAVHDPEVRCDTLRMKAMFYVRYASAGDAVPILAEAFRAAESMADQTDAADCAKLLAATFGRAGDFASCEEWTERALALVRSNNARWFQTHCLSALAGSWVQLGEAAARDGDSGRARLSWTRALQMLDEVELAPAGASNDVAHADNLLPINRAWAEGFLDASRRPAAIQTFRRLLASESRAGLRLSLLLGLSTFLCKEGELGEARLLCEEALSLGDATGVMRQRANLLDLAAEIATMQGRHADAVRGLRQLLKWRDQNAREQAQRASRITALHLKTERALALAKVAHELTRQAQADRDLARRHQSLQALEQHLDEADGLLPSARFGAWMNSAMTRAAQHSRGLPLLVVSASAGKSGWVQQAVKCLSDQLRSGDRWTVLSDDLIVVALQGRGDRRLPLAAARLGRQLASATEQGDAAASCPGVQLKLQLVDVAGQPDVDSAWQLLRANCMA
jgi:DNA-binding winged helix-turn-helix (wHTH) protein